MAKPLSKTGLASSSAWTGLAGLDPAWPILQTTTARNSLSKRQILSKQSPINSNFCRDVSKSVVNVSPKDQDPETSKSKLILKSIFRLGVFSIYLQNSSLCSWGICQIQWLETFLKGHRTCKSTPNMQKSSDQRNHKKVSKWLLTKYRRLLPLTNANPRDNENFGCLC